MIDDSKPKSWHQRIDLINVYEIFNFPNKEASKIETKATLKIYNICKDWLCIPALLGKMFSTLEQSLDIVN